MKRFLALTAIAVMILSALVLTSCSGSSKEDLSDSKYVGTWKCVELKAAGESGELDEDWTITLNGDGTGVSEGGDEDGEFTWSLTDNGFKTKGDVKLTFEDDGDRIQGDLFGAKLVFEKQE